MLSEEPRELCRGPSEEADDIEEWLGWKRDMGECWWGGIARRKTSLWPEVLLMELPCSLALSRGGEDARRLVPVLG